MQFQISYTGTFDTDVGNAAQEAQIKAAITYATNFLDSIYTNNVTINILSDGEEFPLTMETGHSLSQTTSRRTLITATPGKMGF
jgi:hypothetical protein